jgi:hypothetical protein
MPAEPQEDFPVAASVPGVPGAAAFAAAAGTQMLGERSAPCVVGKVGKHALACRAVCGEDSAQAAAQLWAAGAGEDLNSPDARGRRGEVRSTGRNGLCPPSTVRLVRTLYSAAERRAL